MFQTLWLLLAYSYNVILIVFIAAHLFVGGIISFLTGMYMGVYLTQNFEVPRINEPRVVWEKLLSFLEKNRRDPKKVSIGNVLHPSTIKELVADPPDDDPNSPSKTEGIVVPESSNSATFVQTGSQTELELNPLGVYDDEEDEEEERDQITTTSNLDPDLELLPGDEPEDTNPPIMTKLPSDPITGNVTTLILTEFEDMTEEFKVIPPSPTTTTIVEGSLTLDKDKAISRSSTKLN